METQNWSDLCRNITDNYDISFLLAAISSVEAETSLLPSTGCQRRIPANS